jgi:phosphoribosyl 1,2-cyclic phosphate phosphodiesterase
MSQKFTLTVLGSGTSQGVPMIACKCSVCQSTDPRDSRTRSSLYLSSQDESLLLDTTPELRQQALREKIDRVDAVLMTHAHADHIMGFDDLRRFCEITGKVLPIYGSADTLERITQTFGYAFNRSINVTTYVKAEARVVDGPVKIGSLDITPFPLPHGSFTTFGFLFAQNGKPLFAYLNDCKSVSPDVIKAVKGVPFVFIDALRDKPHPTHLCFAEAIEVAREIKAGQTFFIHMTHEKSHVDREAELPDGFRLAYDGMKLEL